jgi:hypothetical protein
VTTVTWAVITRGGQPAGTVTYDPDQPGGRFGALTGSTVTAVITDLGGGYLRVTEPGDEATGGTVVSGWQEAARHIWGPAAEARGVRDAVVERLRAPLPDFPDFLEPDQATAAAEDGDMRTCANCGQVIRRTTIDPDVPWVHDDSGNLYCDVHTPGDAVALAGTPGRSEAGPMTPGNQPGSQNGRFSSSGDDAADDADREVTARQVAAAPPGGPVPARYAGEAERQLRAAGRCWFQTGSGLPGLEYCGHPAEPGCDPGEPGPDEATGTWGMCARHAREASGIEDPDICVGDLVYDPDPDADPDWHGTVTHAGNNGYRVRWDGQDQDLEAGYGQIEPVPGSPGPGVLAARRLEAAVRADHPCDDRSCDIAAALEAGFPHTAAWLLASATHDRPALTRLLAEGAAALPARSEDCGDWAPWTAFHRRHGRRCPACESFTYGDEQAEPGQCAACLAPLPAGNGNPPSDDGETTLDRINAALDDWAETGDAMHWQPKDDPSPDPGAGSGPLVGHAAARAGQEVPAAGRPPLPSAVTVRLADGETRTAPVSGGCYVCPWCQSPVFSPEGWEEHERQNAAAYERAAEPCQPQPYLSIDAEAWAARGCPNPACWVNLPAAALAVARQQHEEATAERRERERAWQARQRYREQRGQRRRDEDALWAQVEADAGITAPPADRRARRGDLIVVCDEHPSFGSGEPYDSYTVGVVTSITRDGTVKTYRPAGEFPEPDWQGKVSKGTDLARHKPERVWVLSAHVVDVPGALAAAACHVWPGHEESTRPCESMEDVRAVLRSHLKTGQPGTWDKLRAAAARWEQARQQALQMLAASRSAPRDQFTQAYDAYQAAAAAANEAYRRAVAETAGSGTRDTGGSRAAIGSTTRRPDEAEATAVAPAGPAGDAYTYGQWQQAVTAVQDRLEELPAALEAMLQSLTAAHAGRSQVTGVMALSGSVLAWIAEIRGMLREVTAAEMPVISAVAAAGGPADVASIPYLADA